MRRAAVRPPKPAPTITTLGLCLLSMCAPNIEIQTMAVQSKIFDAGATPIPAPGTRAWFRAWEVPEAYRRYFTWFQLITAYVFMERTLWSSRLSLQNKWFFVTAVT